MELAEISAVYVCALSCSTEVTTAISRILDASVEDATEADLLDWKDAGVGVQGDVLRCPSNPSFRACA